MASNCVYYVLDRIHEVGGDIQARLSSHWENLHAQHIDQQGRMTHYVPPTDLPSGWQSLRNFEGEVRDYDKDPSPPASIRAIVFGVLCLTFLTLVWAARRSLKSYFA